MNQKLSIQFDKIISFCFFTSVIFSTFSIAGTQISLGITLILFTIFCFSRKYNPFSEEHNILYLLIISYLIWSIISSLVNQNPCKSLKFVSEEWLFLIIPLAVYIFQKPINKKIFAIILSSAVLLISVYGIIQYFTGVTLFKESPLALAPGGGFRVRGSTHPLTFADYFGAASVFLMSFAYFSGKNLSKKLKLLLYSSSLISLIATLLTFSRGAIIGFVAVLLLSLFFLKKRQKLIPVAIFIIIALIIIIFIPGIIERTISDTPRHFGGTYEGGRGFIWKQTVEMISDNLVFGVGAGNYSDVYANYAPKDLPVWWQQPHAHNDFLQATVIYGVIGGILVLLLYLYIFRLLWIKCKIDKNEYTIASVLAFSYLIIGSFYNVPFYDDEVRYLIMIFWSFAFLKNNANKGTELSIKSKIT